MSFGYSLPNAVAEVERLDVDKRVKQDIISIFQRLNKYEDENTAMDIIQYLIRLWRPRPLTPLTGKNEEWVTLGGKVVNKRCPVIVMKDGIVYNTHGYLYRQPKSNNWYWSEESVKYITFPCSPDETVPEFRQLFFSTKYVPLKWAIRFHLYRKVNP